MKKSKVVVTGGAGFIGSHLVKRLVKDGYQVVVVDNLSEGKKENLREVRKELEFHKIDVTDLHKLEKLFGGVDTVFHEAALRSIKRSVDNPRITNDNNITGTLNVLLAARNKGVRKVVFASSSSVYGSQSVKVFREDLCPNPQSPYAMSKLAGEMYCRQFSEFYGLETVSLRYFNVFGPNMDPDNDYALVMPLFISRILAGKPISIHWDGEQSRDFTYIDDVVKANMLAMKADVKSGEVINVSKGKTYSINGLAESLQKIIGKEVKIKRLAKREGDIRYTRGSGEKAKKLLKFGPKVTFDKGLEKTVGWFRKTT